MSCCLQSVQQALARSSGKLRAARALPWRHRGSRLVLRVGVPALLDNKDWGLVRITYIQCPVPRFGVDQGQGGAWRAL